MSLLNQKKKIVLYILSGCLALSVGLYFRLYPLRHSTAQENKEKATLLVINKLKQNARQSIETTYPQIPQAQKDVLSQKLFSKMLRDNSDKIRDSIASVTQQIDQQEKKTGTLLARV